MATSLLVPSPQPETQRGPAGPWSTLHLRTAVALATLITPVLFCLTGYHPSAEDGGLYLTGVRSLLNPTLYQASLPFVTAHLQYSLFAPTLAFGTRVSGLPLEATTLLAHLFCLWLTLFTASVLAAALFPDQWLRAHPSRSLHAQRAGAVLLLAAGLSLPVAGTSLSVADPYLTARSVSTPCILLALAAALHLRHLVLRGAQTSAILRPAAACALALTVGALFHPLMTGYGTGCVVTLLALELRPSPAVPRLLGLALIALILPAVLVHTATPDSPAARAAALTRTYWFLANWRWYELLGLIAPLLLLAAFTRTASTTSAQALARVTLAAGLLSLTIAVLYANANAPTLTLARLQPLRLFQVVYLVMLLLLGAALGELCQPRPLRWTLAILALTATVPLAGYAAFPGSRWLELPQPIAHTTAEPNPWVAAFLWSRNHTPRDALFALDPDYTAKPHEDAHSFRLLAQRSSLADQAKDGGEAAITPALAARWQRDVLAQANLSSLDDVTRHARLAPLGVTWLVLESRAPTHTGCPYDNGVAKICPLP